MITLKLAGLAIGVEARYKYLPWLAKDFLTDDEPIFTVCATDEDIAAERETSEEEFTPGYLEAIVVYRKIADRLPKYDAFVFHGAVLGYDGGAYLFTAKSGTGKSTHTRYWREIFGARAVMVNDDNQ